MSDPRKYAKKLARAALVEAMRTGVTQKVADVVQRIWTETGPDGAYTALMAWCDTVAIQAGVDGSKPVHIAFQARETGEITGAEGVTRPESVWAGQMISARVARDQETFEALIYAIPEGRAMGQHVLALLEMCALTIRQARGGEVA